MKLFVIAVITALSLHHGAWALDDVIPETTPAEDHIEEHISTETSADQRSGHSKGDPTIHIPQPMIIPAPIDVPDRKPDHHPIKDSEQQPIKFPEHRPTGASEHHSAEAPEHRPLDVPEHKPVKIPDNRPVLIPEHRPVKIPEHPPLKVPEHRPVQLPEHWPAFTPEHRPVKIPENRPVQIPEHRPVQVPEHRPVQAPEHRPVQLPAHWPIFSTENRPERQPEHRPEQRPEHRPQIRPEHKPENRPEHRPEIRPEHKPDHQNDKRPIVIPTPIYIPNPDGEEKHSERPSHPIESSWSSKPGHSEWLVNPGHSDHVLKPLHPDNQQHSVHPVFPEGPLHTSKPDRPAPPAYTVHMPETYPSRPGNYEHSTHTDYPSHSSLPEWQLNVPGMHINKPYPDWLHPQNSMLPQYPMYPERPVHSDLSSPLSHISEPRPLHPLTSPYTDVHSLRPIHRPEIISEPTHPTHQPLPVHQESKDSKEMVLLREQILIAITRTVEMINYLISYKNNLEYSVRETVIHIRDEVDIKIQEIAKHVLDNLERSVSKSKTDYMIQRFCDIITKDKTATLVLSYGVELKECTQSSRKIAEHHIYEVDAIIHTAEYLLQKFDAIVKHCSDSKDIENCVRKTFTKLDDGELMHLYLATAKLVKQADHIKAMARSNQINCTHKLLVNVEAGAKDITRQANTCLEVHEYHPENIHHLQNSHHQLSRH